MSSFSVNEDIAEQRIFTFKFIDVIGKKTGDTVRRALGPAGLHVVHLVAENTFERIRQLTREILKEPREVRLEPIYRVIAAAD